MGTKTVFRGNEILFQGIEIHLLFLFYLIFFSFTVHLGAPYRNKMW